MIQLTIITTGLFTGGAENALHRVFTRLNRNLFKVNVVTLIEMGPVGRKIWDAGIEVHVLGMRRGTPNPFKIIELSRWLCRQRPDMIQTWMYHADLVGGLAATLAGGIPVIWGVRHSNLDRDINKAMTRWTARVCGLLADRIPVRIACCSESSRETHRDLGYPQGKIDVIPNGFDMDVFHPDPAARISVREELGLPVETILVGLVGRFDSQKDHRNFLRSAGILCKKWPDIHFFLCGEGITWRNVMLARWVEEEGIRHRCHLLGFRADVPRITGALDVAVLSSRGEGFPNVVGEAMCCEVPCVVTNVGDAARMVGDTGRIVPPSDPVALATAIGELIEMPADIRRGLGVQARMRVEKHYSLESVVEKYETLYLGVYEKLKR